MAEERPKQELGATKVVVQSPENGDGTQPEQQTYDNVLACPNGGMKVDSDRPSEDVFPFGLPLSQNSEFVQRRQIYFVAPSERSITQTKADGLCIYCQLLLMTDVPQYAIHQRSFQLLLDSGQRRLLCKVITASLFKG